MSFEPTSISALIPAIRAAGKAAMTIYDRGCEAMTKADQTPVTEADLAVDAILAEAITARFAGIPIVSEERVDSHGTVDESRFFLVDPIDGTKEFLNRTGEFTINVAIIEDGTPVAGIVFAPALGRLFVGTGPGFAHEYRDNGSQTQIDVRDCADHNLVAMASLSHMTDSTRDFLDHHRISQTVQAGSSLKFCLLAAGEADIYPRFGPTMEWDTAAGDAVLRAAGGRVLTTDGKPLMYGKPGLRNPDFIACSPGAEQRCRLTEQAVVQQET